MSLMSRSMHTVQQRKPSGLKEGAAQTGSIAKHLRVFSSVDRQLVCSLFCLFCYWQHAVFGMLCPEGFWGLYWDGGSGLSLWSFLSQFPPDSKSSVQIFQSGWKLKRNVLLLHHEFLFQKIFSIYQCYLDNLEKTLDFRPLAIGSLNVSSVWIKMKQLPGTMVLWRCQYETWVFRLT